jgi:hypothetical protein
MAVAPLDDAVGEAVGTMLVTVGAAVAGNTVTVAETLVALGDPFMTALGAPVTTIGAVGAAVGSGAEQAGSPTAASTRIFVNDLVMANLLSASYHRPARKPIDMPLL